MFLMLILYLQSLFYILIFQLLFAEEQTYEPGLSTVVMNFENEFDPYEAVSTPIYQTATFKQVKI